MVAGVLLGCLGRGPATQKGISLREAFGVIGALRRAEHLCHVSEELSSTRQVAAYEQGQYSQAMAWGVAKSLFSVNAE